MSSRKVVLLAYDRWYPQIGGLERLIAELGSRLSHRYQVVVLAQPARGLHPGADVPGVEGIRIHWWHPDLTRYMATARCLIGFGFTPQSPRSIYPLMMARRALAAGVPVAWCPTFSPPASNTRNPSMHRPGWKRLVPRSLRRMVVASAMNAYHRILERAVTIFALTPDEQSHWMKRYPDRVVLLPHGVGAKHALCPIGPECRSRLAARFGAGPNLLAVGRFVENKNQEVLIRALPLLRARWPTMRLLLVGPERDGSGPRLRALADQPDFDGVEFLGTVPDQAMCELYAGADCLVHAARHEASGLTPLEALAHGTPVVHSGRGALARYDGLPGCYRVADPESPADWAATLAAVLESPDTIAQAATGRQVVFAGHTWERMAEEVAASLGRLLDEGGQLEKVGDVH